MRKYGVLDIDSVPPARTARLRPSGIESKARAIAFIDEAQALFTVIAGTDTGTPARNMTCRAVFVPPPAWRPWPKRHSSTASGATPARRIASFAAATPRSEAFSGTKLPPNLPIGVRTAPATTTSMSMPPRLRSAPDASAFRVRRTVRPRGGDPGHGVRPSRDRARRHGARRDRPRPHLRRVHDARPARLD